MKKFILAALLVGATVQVANAATLFTAENKNGGRIELTDVLLTEKDFRNFPQCRSGESAPRMAKTWSNGNDSDSYGCWTYDDNAGTVNIIWVTGTGRNITYDSDMFIPTEKAKQNQRENNRQKANYY